ncbi:MAG: fibronectin type III domain-containing protein [Acidobacteria bacterium]|nr:fibronectin type III domain-containing protein [Acidobacteriota bacterium]
MRKTLARPLVLLTALALLPAALALAPRQEPLRFDALAIPDPGAAFAIRALAADRLPADDALRAGWGRFAAEQGPGWRAHVDERSGLPTLASGGAIDWRPTGKSPDLVDLESAARALVGKYPGILGAGDGQFELDREASRQVDERLWFVTFRQVVGGVPVEGARYDFHVHSGNLVALGASRWAPVTRSPLPRLPAEQARAALYGYLGAGPGDVVDLAAPALRFVPVDPRGTPNAEWNGARGAGYDHLLVWRFELKVPGEPATWIAEVDADGGNVVALWDDTRYGRVKGGVYPISNDQDCPTGCEQPEHPLPFVDFSENGGAVQYSGDHGLYSCTTLGSTMRTTLVGPYIRVNDNCGTIAQTTTCDDDLDLAVGPGTDCQVPPGSSAGNTHSARTSFYHLNRSMEKGRAWLPNNNWLKQRVTDNVNINATCNAFWDGSVNFYKSGGGCRNTGEIMGVFVHEWGHGIDQNDGGGYDNPSEAYADVVAFFETRESCVGRGFYMSQNCGGYGDACLDCTGIRDQDWDKHASHTPVTPGGFIRNNCGGGSGPCGKETHCEGYLAGNAVWDLAARDLPAAGLDGASAWQLAERLFYKSREGSGGNAYNCSLPNADGCGTTSWFHKMLVVDDDDGNLGNGTPHAAAIFAAYNRHGIACGGASDPSNQNHSSCPALAKPVLRAQAGSNLVQLAWDPVPNANSYLLLRNDLGCSLGQIIVDTIPAPGTSATDDNLANGFTVHYRLQAVGANAACQSPVSDCVSAAPQPFAGTVRFEQPTYACAAAIGMRVTDANVGAPSVTVRVWSATEMQPETLVLNETPPASGKFAGSIPATADPPVAGDGRLSIRNGDALTVEYVDADDGLGGHDLARRDNSTGDCVGPVITNVRDSGTTDVRSTLRWSTDEVSDSVTVWGPVIPPDRSASGDPRTSDHQVTLTGLQACTVYYYEVRSTDPAGNLAASDNGGQYFHFETLGNFGAGLQPCHAGRVTLDGTTWSCSDSVSFRVVDLDLNANPLLPDTATVLVTSTTESAPELATITETGANTSIFVGAIPTDPGVPAADGKLQARNGDVLTVTYLDGDDGTGAGATSYATAALDCGGPEIGGVSVGPITSARATINFTTSEPGTTIVEFGPTPALGSVVSDSGLTTSHRVTLNQSDICQKVYFRVKSADVYGNLALADNGGQPFAVQSYDIPGLYWRDTFESGAGNWTLDGEWEVGPPQGKGGSSGAADPLAAYNNSAVLGYDLTGRGTYPGDYEPSQNKGVRTVALDATNWSNTKLLFFRKLQVGANDAAFIMAWWSKGNRDVWRNAGPMFDGAFVPFSLDLSAYFDHQSTAAIEFRQQSDGSGNYSGWNIDDVILKDGARPDFAPCGGCSAAPSFAGVRSAIDNDACGATGVTVSWDAAPSWGSGGGGTYAVYRGAAPGFPADAAHLVAAGVSALSYNDAAAPAGQLFYLVRAENDESCGGGPANGGLPDDNAAYRGVSQTTTRPLPGPVPGLALSLLGRAHVRLGWQPAADASAYRVYRSLAPQAGGFGLLGTSSLATFDDIGAGATQETFYYLVRGANACGQEGP